MRYDCETCRYSTLILEREPCYSCENFNNWTDGGGSTVRSMNVGTSDYSKHKIQPWDIWLEYKLNPWDADIIKRVLRTKKDTPRREDYEKIIHVAQERIRQIDEEED